MRRGHNDNHPRKGSSIKVGPIRSRGAIRRIKTLLYQEPRNLCLFTLGINTAYRANELLSLAIEDVAYLKVGDTLELKQSKNGDYRRAVLNTTVIDAIQQWLHHHPKRLSVSAPLFLSRRGRKAITVSALNQLVKAWCRGVGLPGNFGSHSLRKTWGYHQRIHNHASVALLVRAFGHATEAQTLAYLGILPDEIKSLYLSMEL